jgi:hypothetical protein
VTHRANIKKIAGLAGMAAAATAVVLAVGSGTAEANKQSDLSVPLATQTIPHQSTIKLPFWPTGIATKTVPHLPSSIQLPFWPTAIATKTVPHLPSSIQLRGFGG